MAEWSHLEGECYNQQYDYNQYNYACQSYNYQPACYDSPVQYQPVGKPSPPQTAVVVLPKENPREIRNKAEKQRRDKLNQSIKELASMVPPVLAANRKVDKTGVLRLTAHFLRSHQYVFGDSIGKDVQIRPSSAQTVLQILNGFLLTVTYRGLVVVVSPNVHKFLGYHEMDLLGQSVYTIVHEDDHRMLREQLLPRSCPLGPNGELLMPNEVEDKERVAAALAGERRNFVVRLKRFSQRSQPAQYVSCHIEGSFRKSDKACRNSNRCCQMLRRARARGDNPCSSGNDIVFVGMVRPTAETFMSESELEAFRMEYWTRHSIDGEIIQCGHRISLVTGYMTSEVHGVNAMNFMHRDDVRWVIIALREMYDNHRLFGESCYRLMTKNGQLVYMRTRGRLEVDPNTSAVTSFVCSNSVVDEKEGKHLIKLMKKKFTLLVNNTDEDSSIEDEIRDTDSQYLPVEDPRHLEKVILHLVTNLPSPASSDSHGSSPECGESRLAIIPPKKERIVGAIEKIYTVFKAFRRDPPDRKQENFTSESIPEILPGPSASLICGTKRAIDYEQHAATKKKVVEIDEKEADKSTGNVDNIFSDSSLFPEESPEFDANLDTLVDTDEPFFPDLLVSTDVQDILQKIEEESPINIPL